MNRRTIIRLAIIVATLWILAGLAFFLTGCQAFTRISGAKAEAVSRTTTTKVSVSAPTPPPTIRIRVGPRPAPEAK